MRAVALGLAVLLSLPATGLPQTAPPAVTDPEIKRGITLVDEGEYDAAILALDAAVRRLSAKGGHSTAELADAYFHLGVAYLAKGHETSAKARFREAVRQMRDMSPNPERFPPRVIELFEKAREESRAEGAATAAASTAPKAEKKGGSSKALLLVGGLAVVGGGAAIALGGGSAGGDGAAGGSTQTRTETGSVANNEQSFFRFTASRAGTFEATLTWQDRNVGLTIGCQEVDPPYTQCPGSFQRTSDTSGRFSSAVTQREYLISVSNFSGRSGSEPFSITLRYP